MIYTNHDLHKMAKVKYSCMLLQTQCFLTHLLYVSGLENKVMLTSRHECIHSRPDQTSTVMAESRLQ